MRGSQARRGYPQMSQMTQMNAGLAARRGYPQMSQMTQMNAGLAGSLDYPQMTQMLQMNAGSVAAKGERFRRIHGTIGGGGICVLCAICRQRHWGGRPQMTKDPSRPCRMSQMIAQAGTYLDLSAKSASSVDLRIG